MENCTSEIPSENISYYEFAPLGIVLVASCYSVVALASVVGNIFQIWVIYCWRRQASITVTNHYIANIAVADIILAVFVIPLEFHSTELQRWDLPHFLCGGLPFMHVVSVSVSILSMAAMAWNKKESIVHPLRSLDDRKPFKLIFIIWIVSSLMAAPNLLTMRTCLVDRGQGPFYYCHPFLFDPNEILAYATLICVVQYIFPLAILIFTCVCITRTLSRTVPPGNPQRERDRNRMQTRIMITRKLRLAVIMFGVSWFPLQTYNVLSLYFPLINDWCWIKIFWFAINWFAMTHCCANPIIYGQLKQVSDELKVRMLGMFRRGSLSTETTSANNTTPNSDRTRETEY